MARISEMKGKKDNGYTRLFGDRRLGHLISQTHAASIRAGSELQNMINADIEPDIITTIDDIARGNVSQDVEVVCRPKRPKTGETKAIESDYAVFFHLKKHFFLIELKDGDTFDTQKCPATKRSLQSNAEYITHRTGYAGSIFVCSFNASSKQAIIEGFKKNFSIDQVMTGYELCMYLGVDYENIIEKREEDQKDNKYYLLGQVAKVERDMSQEEYFEEKRRIEAAQLRMFWVKEE